MAQAAGRLAALVSEVLGAPLPLRLRAWDGSEAGPVGTPTLVIRNRRALHRLLWKPGELGLARAWVAGEIDIEGDLYEALNRMAPVVWRRDEAARPIGLRDRRILGLGITHWYDRRGYQRIHPSDPVQPTGGAPQG